MGAVVDAVVALFGRGDDAVAADRRLARAVAADPAVAAGRAVVERAADCAAEVGAALADAFARVVRVAAGVAPLRVAGHAAQRAVALAAGVGPVLVAEVALFRRLPEAIAAVGRSAPVRIGLQSLAASTGNRERQNGEQSPHPKASTRSPPAGASVIWGHHTH